MKKTVILLSMFWASSTLAEGLSGAQITQALSGATLRGTTDQGQPYRTEYGQNGEVRGMSGFDGEFTDKGRWSVEGDLYCIEYQVWLGGEKFCSKVEQDGNVMAFTETKSGITTYAVLSK